MQSIYQRLTIYSASLGAAALVCCTTISTGPVQQGEVSQRPVGQTKEGSPVTLFTLRNKQGAEAAICNYGGLVISLKVPDRNGQFGDVVLGYDNLADYIKDTPYFGAMIGRYGNRIAKGKFTLDGKEYTLAINNGPNALHGGIKGFAKVVWEPKILAWSEGPSLQLLYT